MAERCSCKDAECTLHHVSTAAIEEIMDQAKLELRPSKCTRMNLLRGVLNMVYNETGPKTPIRGDFQCYSISLQIMPHFLECELS